MRCSMHTNRKIMIVFFSSSSDTMQNGWLHLRPILQAIDFNYKIIIVSIKTLFNCIITELDRVWNVNFHKMSRSHTHTQKGERLLEFDQRATISFSSHSSLMMMNRFATRQFACEILTVSSAHTSVVLLFCAACEFLCVCKYWFLCCC